MSVSEISANEPAALTGDEKPLNQQLLKEAIETFFRELPSLLETWPGYWIAYHGKERLGISYRYQRLDRKFTLPPLGKYSIWERLFGARNDRFAERDVSMFFITPCSLEYEFDVDNEPVEMDDDEPQAIDASQH